MTRLWTNWSYLRARYLPAQYLRAIYAVTATLALSGWACLSASATPKTIEPKLLSEFLHNGFWAVMQVDSTLVCAMDGGLGVLTLDTLTTNNPGHFVIRDFVSLASRPLSLRYDNSTIVTRLADNTYKFFSLSAGLKFKELGGVSYPNEIQDYLYQAGNLYFAEEFKGLSMYRVNNFSNLIFVDSSMVGVRVIQLALSRDTLYALDDYNGILRYAHPESGLKSIPGYLYLPFQIRSFSRESDHLNLAAGNDGFKAATFDSLGAFATLQEWNSVSFAVKVFETDSNYVIVSTPNVIETINKSDPGDLRLTSVSGNTLGSALAQFGDKQVFVTPSDEEGLQGLWMNTIPSGKLFARFDHPGPILALQLVDGFLYTAGRRNAFEKYDIFGENGPELLGSRPSPPGAITSAVDDDTLYLVDESSGVPLLWVIHTLPGDLPVALDAFGAPPEVEMMSTHRSVNGGKIYFMRSGNKYFVNRAERDELFGPVTTQLNLGVGVTAATIAEDRVYQYSSKGSELTVSSLNRFFRLTELGSVTMPGTVSGMLEVKLEQALILFSAGRVRVLNTSGGDLLAPIADVFIAGSYTSAVERDGLVFAVGPNSTGVLSLENGEVQELYFEPTGASLVTVGNGVFATTDGSSIKIYEFIQTDVNDDGPIVFKPDDFRLLSNYPNPFNGETLIRFSGAPKPGSESEILVYNVLGQTVRALPVNGDSDGLVRWDGRNEDGVEVASGMYFARLVSPKVNGARAIKMIFLK